MGATVTQARLRQLCPQLFRSGHSEQFLTRGRGSRTAKPPSYSPPSQTPSPVGDVTSAGAHLRRCHTPCMLGNIHTRLSTLLIAGGPTNGGATLGQVLTGTPP